MLFFFENMQLFRGFRAFASSVGSLRSAGRSVQTVALLSGVSFLSFGAQARADDPVYVSSDQGLVTVHNQRTTTADIASGGQVLFTDGNVLDAVTNSGKLAATGMTFEGPISNSGTADNEAIVDFTGGYSKVTGTFTNENQYAILNVASNTLMGNIINLGTVNSGGANLSPPSNSTGGDIWNG